MKNTKTVHQALQAIDDINVFIQPLLNALSLVIEALFKQGLGRIIQPARC